MFRKRHTAPHGDGERCLNRAMTHDTNAGPPIPPYIDAAAVAHEAEQTGAAHARQGVYDPAGWRLAGQRIYDGVVEAEVAWRRAAVSNHQARDESAAAQLTAGAQAQLVAAEIQVRVTERDFVDAESDLQLAGDVLRGRVADPTGTGRAAPHRIGESVAIYNLKSALLLAVGALVEVGVNWTVMRQLGGSDFEALLVAVIFGTGSVMVVASLARTGHVSAAPQRRRLASLLAILGIPALAMVGVFLTVARTGLVDESSGSFDTTELSPLEAMGMPWAVMAGGWFAVNLLILLGVFAFEYVHVNTAVPAYARARARRRRAHRVHIDAVQDATLAAATLQRMLQDQARIADRWETYSDELTAQGEVAKARYREILAAHSGDPELTATIEAYGHSLSRADDRPDAA